MNLNYSNGESQYLFTVPTFLGAADSERLQFNSLIIPVSVAILLLSLQVVQNLIEWLKSSRLNNPREPVEGASPHKVPNDSAGPTTFAFSFARCLICLTLTVLSIITLESHPKRGRNDENENYWTSKLRNPAVWMAVTYFYASILAAVSLTRPTCAVRTTRYNNLLLLATLGVFTYRDVWPLATYDQGPADAAEGPLLWAKFGLLTTSAVFIPLLVPRRYVPVDPKDPMPIPNAEQTCSIFSRFIFSYMSPVIWAGYRVEHLEVENMPPLMDTDYSKNLVKNAFPYIDSYKGAKRRHIFFGLIQIFRVEFLLMSTALVVISIANYSSPLAIYRILRYLELGPSYDGLRPWFWVTALFISCASRTFGYTNYHFYATRLLVHAEAILTQLIYEHSLRIRLASESANDKDLPGVTESPSVEGNSPKAKSIPANRHGAESDNLIGRINNLITVDLGNVTQSRDFLFLVLAVPLQVILCIVFLYRVLGWSAIVGVVSLVFLLPVPGYVTKLLHDVQKRKMQLTDTRVQKVSEAVSVLKMIKLFGWESKISGQIQNARNDELAAVLRMKILGSLTILLNSMIPTMSMLITYMTYAGFLKQKLDAAIIFSTLTAFGTLSQQLYEISGNLTQTTQGKVSLDRIDDFLKNSELLDTFDTTTQTTNSAGVPVSNLEDEIIGFRNASFSWSLASASSDGPHRKFRLTVDELIFKPGCINLIVGPTGCGKTSMLMALLGEMHYIPNERDSWFNLPRDGGVAYAAQESWVQNDTIRNNVLFGQAYDEVRYQKVIKQTALDKDLELFEAGDNTEVGERGITLSGGQKARVTLARAIYSQAEILLLDDILASLDVHTASWIVEACLKGDLVRGRTVILVTHNVGLVSPIAQFVVSIGAGGTINGQNTNIDRALMTDAVLAAEMEMDKRTTEQANEERPAKEVASTAGKLILAEEVPKGHLSRRSMMMFLSALGGKYPILFFALWISGFFISESFKAFQKWFLGYWGAQYESHDPYEVSVSYYVLLYSLIILGSIVLSNLSYCFYLYGAIRASRKINEELVASVLTSTLRWIDETPTSRIVTRFTQDLDAVDNTLSHRLYIVTAYAVIMLTSLTVVVIFSPIFILPGLLVVSIGFMVGRVYLSSQLSAKREQSNAKSPVLAHFNAAIAGIVSIRAYAAQDSFKREASKRIDKYSRISRTTYNLTRWVAIRIDFLGDLYNAALAYYLVYRSSITSSNAGFSLNMATDLCSYILWAVLLFNDFIVQSNSLERIQGYINIEHEPSATESGKPPAAWPTSGDLVVEKLSARYSRDGPTVLQDISFHVKSGERVGIVGRTGSGKSSLTLALLRGIITDGNIYFDGIVTSAINLDALRSNITIIPQMPELLSGTLRRNLDPFDQHDDAALNEALQSVGLFLLQDERGEARITLDSSVTAGGGNLSVGERQIVALARAILRRSKLLILDEATSAIDYKTDKAIQTTLRHKLEPGVTVITVAHRLQTIMDADKIIVLDTGRLAEFDSPSALLKQEDSLFKALVDGSADKATLYDMANGATIYNAEQVET